MHGTANAFQDERLVAGSLGVHGLAFSAFQVYSHESFLHISHATASSSTLYVPMVLEYRLSNRIYGSMSGNCKNQ